MPDRGHPPANLAAAWALAGVAALLSFATIRLGLRGIEAVRQGLGPTEWIALVAITVLFVWMEGHHAFEKRWVPRVIARTASLRRQAGPLERLLAPLYAMSLISDSRRRLVRSWSLTTGIVLAVLIVTSLPGPWRGIIDLAVAAALVWGIGAIALQARHAFA